MMTDNFIPQYIDTLILWHLLLSSTVTIIGILVLNKRYPNQKNLISAFFFIFTFSLPLLGAIFGLWLIYYFWKHEHTFDTLRFETISLDAFFLKFPIIKRRFGDGAAHELLHNETIPLIKQLSVLSMLSKHKNKANIHIVKKLLSSENDELRLLSFAAVNGLEEDIHTEIHSQYEQLKQIGEKDLKEQANIKRKLALSYWELVYFQLADESLKKFILQKVEDYCNAVIDIFPEEKNMYLLLGKIYFERQDDNKATKYFAKAITIGRKKKLSNIKYIMPYLAEINYNKRHFKAVKNIISEVDTFNQSQLLKPIHEIWS